MVVSYKISGLDATTSSNKPGQNLVTHSDVAYVYVSKPPGFVLKPKIDKISITLPIASKDQAGVKSLLVSLIKDPDEPQFSDAPTIWKKGRYKLVAALAVSGTNEIIRIEADPQAKKASFLRFELNPAKLGTAGLAYFKSQLPQFLLDNPEYADIATKGRVTFLDVACDLINVSLGHLIFRSIKEGKSHSYSAASGSLETAYLSLPEKGPALIKLYDKQKQLNEVEGAPKYGSAPHTRIEFRIVPNCPISELGKYKSPLTKVEIWNVYGVTPPQTPYQWEFFVDSCRQRGVGGACVWR
jgi:hypothetical protein